jgi:hypothetical protein
MCRHRHATVVGCTREKWCVVLCKFLQTFAQLFAAESAVLRLNVDIDIVHDTSETSYIDVHLARDMRTSLMQPTDYSDCVHLLELFMPKFMCDALVDVVEFVDDIS